MKKVINIFMIFVFLVPIFCVPDVAHAETLSDLKAQLQKKEEEYKQNENKKELTKAEIASINSSIKTIEGQIQQTYVDIANLDIEIEKLNKDIAAKEKEIKDIVNFIQVSNGESAYLEYAFGAKDFTDFIYRMAVAEQLTTYNETLIAEYNTKIEESKKKQEELSSKRVTLGTQQNELAVKKNQLSVELEEIASTSVNISDEIEYQKEIIELYKSKGCQDNEDIKTCGRSTLPPGTAFYRPTNVGQITSEWGYRDFAGRSWHEGIDIGISEGTPVYSVANGMVATIFERYSCGGNMVIVHHNINGQTYTSVYAHLLSINVSKGQTVNRNTVIGYSGGYSTSAYYSGSYDSCSYGAHLHLTVALGLYGVDYNFTSMNYTYSINPRNVINFPGLYSKWSDRLTAY